MADTVVASGTQANASSPAWCVGTQFTVSQSFQPSASGRVVRASAVVGRFNSNPDTLVVKLKRASNGRVQGPALATTTTPALQGSRTYSVTFDAPATVTAGEQYALELSATGSVCDLFTYGQTVVPGGPGQQGVQYDRGAFLRNVVGFGFSVTTGGQDPPSCAGEALSTAFNTAADLVPTCTGTGLTYSVRDAPAHGTLGPVGADGKVRYTPAEDAFGTDSFSLTATDSEGQTATDRVTVDVAKPTPPSCAGDAAQTPFNTPGDATFSCSGTKVTYAIGDGPSHGSLSGLSGNTVRYAPNGGFQGEDRFTVVATDVAGQRAVGTVRVAVDGPLDSAESPNDQVTHQVAQGSFSVPAGERVEKTVSCQNGQIATDGHALVRSLDQDAGTPADVRVSRASRTAPDTYAFEILNPTGGQAQGQLNVDCLSPSTFLGHRLAVGTPIQRTVAVPAGGTETAVRCPDGTTAIAPGVAEDTTGVPGAALLTASEPAAGGSAWRFAFASDLPRSVDVSVSCLGYATDDGSLLWSRTGTEATTVAGGTTSSSALDCPVGTVGLVGGHSAPPSLVALGQEAQARTRLFRLQNTDAADGTATLSVLCVGLTTRTTSSPVTPAGTPSPEPPAPAPVAAAAAQDPAVAPSPPDPQADPTPPASTSPGIRRLIVPVTVAARVSVAKLRSGLPVAVTVPRGGGTLSIVATDAGKRVGSATRKLTAGRKTVSLPVSKSARRRLGRSGHRKLKLTISLGGTSLTKVVRVTR
jgi:hypothetical protein